MRKIIICRTIAAVTLLPLQLFSQSTQLSAEEKSVLKSTNAVSTEEFNSKLTNYIRVVADHITNDKSGYTLKMSLLALKDSSSWTTDNDFLSNKIRFLRNTEIAGGVTLNNNQKIAGLNLGFTFTLLNRRDSAVFVYIRPGITKERSRIGVVANQQYFSSLIKSGQSKENAQKIADAALLTLNKYNISHNEDDIDPTFKSFLDKATKQSSSFKGLTYREAFERSISDFVNYTKSVQRKPLWTIYPSASYDYSGGGFDKIGFGSTFLAGLGKNLQRKPWELDIEGGFYAQNDTSSQKTDMDEHVAFISAGINKVLLQNDRGESKMEFKFDGKYQYNFQKNVIQQTPTINATFKVLVIKSLWIPLTVSYDPNKGNVFGFINVAVNINK